jgi:hypothetical protein
MAEASLGVAGSYWLGLQRPAVGKPFAWNSGGWPRRKCWVQLASGCSWSRHMHAAQPRSRAAAQQAR